mmetsp:Transcript_17174/g.53796  ORF Transcript_17174/g.53796 Transcript_17174/m.53796 type:complete len:337 (-) Transcript_17174:197-1207(-)
MASSYPGLPSRCTDLIHANQLPYYHESQQMYGSFDGAFPESQEKLRRSPRRRMNAVAMALALFVPWTLFCAVFAVMSFSLHYQRPQLAYLLVGLAFFLVIVLGLCAVDAARSKAASSPMRETTWYAFMFATSLLAWSLAVVLGGVNFFRSMQPFYDIRNLNVYASVDPVRMRGQQLMDAGRLVFTPGSRLDIGRSMGFRNLDTYCVAPVTLAGGSSNVSEAPSSFDFWAVGLNCCSGSGPDFHCGEFNNPKAHAGLRLMREDQRPFFRLAVQQAEAAYNIKALHPLFLHWMQDPLTELNAYQEDGFSYFLLAIFSHFSLQLFLAIAGALASRPLRL